MKKRKAIVLLLCLVLMMTMLAGCKKNDDKKDGNDAASFSYSDGIGKDGFWEGVKASEIVTLPDDYKAIPLAAKDIEVTDTALESAIDDMLYDFRYEVQITDRSPVLGDTINYTFDGHLEDGTTSNGMTITEPTTLVLGSGGMIPGFEDAIVAANAMPGDTFDINVTFPDPYENNTDLSGKKAIFKIHLNYISEMETPELTDDFVAENFSETDNLFTVAQLRKNLSDMIYRQNIRASIEDHLLQDSTFGELPQSMIDYQMTANEYYYNMMANYYGIDLETYLYYFTACTSIEEVNETYLEDYKNAVKYFLACQAVAEKDGISVSDADVESYFADNYSDATAEDFIEFYGEGYVNCIILNNKVLETLEKTCVIQ